MRDFLILSFFERTRKDTVPFFLHFKFYGWFKTAQMFMTISDRSIPPMRVSISHNVVAEIDNGISSLS